MADITLAGLVDIGGYSDSEFDLLRYHVLGGSFGTKATADVVYENFDSRDIGAITTDVGRIKQRIGGGGSVANSSIFAGRKCWRQDFSNNVEPGIYVQLNPTLRAYHACHFRFAGEITGTSCSWKFGRVGINTDPYAGNRYAHMYTSSGSQTPQSSAPDLTIDGGAAEHAATNEATDNPNIFQQNTNIFYEYECYAGTVDGNDSVFVVRANGQEIVRFTGSPLRTTAMQSLITRPMSIVGMRNPTTNNMIYQLGEFYFDASRSRCVLTNNAIYASSTKFAVQPSVFWLSDSVVFEKNGPGFSVGESAFLHVWDDDGVKVGGATAVTVDANYIGVS